MNMIVLAKMLTMYIPEIDVSIERGYVLNHTFNLKDESGEVHSAGFVLFEGENSVYRVKNEK